MKQSRLQKVIAVLKAHKHQRVSLPEIMQAGGAQFGARLKEARKLGFIITNEMERTSDGEVWSWYTLTAEPGENVTVFPE